MIESLSLYIYMSNHKFQESRFLSFTQEYTGAIYSHYSNANQYINLKDENNYLKRENAKLYTLLSKEEYNANTELQSYITSRIIKNSIFKKVMGKDTDDFESFIALDKIKEQRRQRESHMRLYGRPGLYDSWVEYQGQARKARREAEKQRQKDREEFIEAISIFLGVLVFLGIAAGGVYLFYTYKM